MKEEMHWCWGGAPGQAPDTGAEAAAPPQAVAPAPLLPPLPALPPKSLAKSCSNQVRMAAKKARMRCQTDSSGLSCPPAAAFSGTAAWEPALLACRGNWQAADAFQVPLGS